MHHNSVALLDLQDNFHPRHIPTHTGTAAAGRVKTLGFKGKSASSKDAPPAVLQKIRKSQSKMAATPQRELRNRSLRGQQFHDSSRSCFLTASGSKSWHRRTASTFGAFWTTIRTRLRSQATGRPEEFEETKTLQ